jgi:hypothetical protein
MANRLVTITLCVMLGGCSLVQWLPSSSCEEVTYQRLKNQVEVYARCKV